MKKTQIMLVEDSPAYRAVIQRTFGKDNDVELISQFASAEGALRSLQDIKTRKEPDVVLLDLNLPGMSGIEAIPWLKKQLPNAEIIVLTQSGREADVLDSIHAGASGYILKTSTLKQLTDAIHNVVQGGAVIDPPVANFLLSSFNANLKTPGGEDILSSRELEVLSLIGDGLQKKQIARKLKISLSTVATHIEHIYHKLQVKNAAAAVNKAHRRGIFPKE